ncbi:MAG: hypothetical protein EOS34_32900 [Mesorhizobium sp.]|nr:MAG: hypothetical protein EOS34_32900 [Mesorhizobium sp.]
MCSVLRASDLRERCLSDARRNQGPSASRRVRGAAPLDRGARAHLMAKISRFVEGFPEIDELDLNPVLAYHYGLTVLDVHILLTEFSGAHSTDKQGIEA